MRTMDAQRDRTVETLVCTSRDGFCPVFARVEGGRVAKNMTRNRPLFKGALRTTTIDQHTGPDDPADAWRPTGLEPPR